jgi:predicted HicB family RNase H-like nuclease
VNLIPASKAQQKAVTKYMKENYDEIKVRVEKGRKSDIKAHADSRGESVNSFIGRAIDETMERDKQEAGE